MGGMGPAPKPPGQRARRNATVAMTRLPAGGRQGKTPVWPLLDDIALSARRDVLAAKADKLRFALEDTPPGPEKARLERRLEETDVEVAILDKRMAAQRGLEKKLWRELWKTPQAVAWERLGWVRDVGQYVRWKVLAELGDLDAAREARQLSDRIGLTPLAMLRLRWEIVDEEEMAERPSRRRRTADRSRSSSTSTPSGPPAADPRSILHVV